MKGERRRYGFLRGQARRLVHKAFYFLKYKADADDVTLHDAAKRQDTSINLSAPRADVYKCHQSLTLK